ncbi:MAG: FmdB family zinc ribbon protein [Actinomycetota bacterium]
MPTYEYTCRDCGHTFEIVQSMLDEALTMCPECGGSLRKVFAAPAISFKGSGFYATDHGKKSNEQGESKDAGEKSGQKSGETREKTAAEGKESKGSKDSSKGGSSETTSKPSKKEPAAS